MRLCDRPCWTVVLGGCKEQQKYDLMTAFQALEEMWCTLLNVVGCSEGGECSRVPGNLDFVATRLIFASSHQLKQCRPVQISGRLTDHYESGMRSFHGVAVLSAAWHYARLVGSGWGSLSKLSDIPVVVATVQLDLLSNAHIRRPPRCGKRVRGRRIGKATKQQGGPTW